MADKNYGLLISALVAMVAIVGLVVLLSGGNTGAVVIRGNTGGYVFPSQSSPSLSGHVRETCWYNADGEMECPGMNMQVGKTFGPPKQYREGGEPTVVNSASDRGYWS